MQSAKPRAYLVALGLGLLSLILHPSALAAEGGKEPVNLLSWGAGAMLVQWPASYAEVGEWSPDGLLDELPKTGWATKSGDLTPKVFVFELADPSEITSLAFDTASVENRGRGAKDLKVEIADRKDGSFKEIATPSLAPLKDRQTFALKAPVSGRYLRLTVLSNWGDEKYMELMSVYAYGRPLVKRALPDNSGTFESSYGNFRLQQTGSAVSGCYEHKYGLIENGGFEGRVLRFTWTEGDAAGKRNGGPAVLIFADDGQSFTGYWWYEGSTGNSPGIWRGKRSASAVGACPHWKPGVGNPIVDQLTSGGRVRLYGILFDTDSDRLKDESKPTLDALVAAARAQPSWKLGIEGHTDNTGGDAHNQALSEKRATSIKAYLVNAGIEGGRLTSAGFGAGKPVSSNDTALGRSQNRRVEIVKN